MSAFRGMVLTHRRGCADSYEPFSYPTRNDADDNPGMRTALLLPVLALLCAATARGSNVTVNAPVAGGSTLAVSALNAPSFAVQLNGDDQTATYQTQLQV